MKPKGPANPEKAFGVSVGIVLLLIAAALVWRGRITTAEVLGPIGAVLLALGLTRPSWLKYPSAAWWKMAMFLGHVNARVILTVAFVVVFTPLGLLRRAIGKDPLARQRRNWPGWSPYPPRYADRDHFTKMY